MEWLRRHCYSDRARADRYHQPMLWDSDMIQRVPQFDYSVVSTTDASRLQMLQQLRDYGICLINNLPPRQGQLESFAASLGVVVGTETGKVFEILVKSQEDFKSVAHLNNDLIPHQDDSYREAFPSIIFFHCLAAADDNSGQSVYVDGFLVAEVLRRKKPEAFDLLSQYAIGFCKKYGDIHMEARSPLINLDEEGRIIGVRISNLFVAPLDLPETLVESFYAAYRQLMELYTNPQYQLLLSLQPGDLVILDNHRVLHGRTAIQTENQNRHLRHCYVDRDYLYSQWRRLTNSG